MYTENEIWMQASPARVFALAADVARWPQFLPHYRWVRVQEDPEGLRLTEMAARRGPFPVSWAARQCLLPTQGRITYEHLRGLTAGMKVEWRIIPREGGTHVVIVHDLPARRLLLRTRLGQWIVGDFFIKGIAAQTLLHMKRTAEAEVEDRGGDREAVGRTAR